MKSFLILILSAVFSMAEISSMLVEPVTEFKDKDGVVVRKSGMQVTAYGLLDNGRPKVFHLTTTADKALCTNVENCKWTGPDGLNRSALRYWVFFYGSQESDEDGNVIHSKGDVSKIDIHLSEQWDQKIIQEFDDQMKSQIKKLKDHIESL